MASNEDKGEDTPPTMTNTSGMPNQRPTLTRWRGWAAMACLMCTSAGLAGPEIPDANSAATLKEAYLALREKLTQNSFNLPLHLDSRQTADGWRGDIHAIIDYPFAVMCTALKGTPQWCDILLLHLNVKYCEASEDKRGHLLTVYIGRKHEQPLDDAYRVEFVYEIAAETPDYRHVVLSAKKGPVGTRDYRIMLEAIALDRSRTFLHFSYAYAYGFAAKVATRAYFSTMGSSKIGFTIVGQQPDGQPIYVDDMRAALERNTMRYFLAIDAYMGALSVPPEEQFERRLHSWFAATERYPLQLHEVTEGEYLAMKRNEYRRQQPALR